MANPPGQLQAHKIGAPVMNLIKCRFCSNYIYRSACLGHCPTIGASLTKEPINLLLSWVFQELLKIESVLCDQIPVVRRFTGGGTVVVDLNTMFVTFICNKDAVAGLQPYPQPIMSWASALYNKVFQGIGDFHLRENDYVFGDRKFGGNAQSITKNRCIQHASFLWDYEVRNMAYLKLPARAPENRLARGHLEFICCMKDFMSRSEFINRTVEAAKTHFSLRSAEAESIETAASVNIKFCPTTRLLTKHELEAAAFASPSLGSLSRSL